MRDGLLRLINRRFDEFNQATGNIEKASGVGKLLSLIGVTAEAQMDFLQSRATEVSLLSSSPRQLALVKSILAATPDSERRELFDLYLAAPELLEAHELLNQIGKRDEECLRSFPTLITPLGVDHKKRTLAQIISALGRNNKRGAVNILFDHRDWFLAGATNSQFAPLVSDLLLGLELLDRPSKFFTSCKSAIEAGDREEARRIINETLGPNKPSAAAPTSIDSTPTIVIDSTAAQALPEWCRWVSAVLPEGETPRNAFKDHISAHGKKLWFKKMIFSEQHLSTYLRLLANGGTEDINTFLLERAREEQPASAVSEVTTKQSNYSKIIICGGSGGPEKEAAFRESFPEDIELDFYYGENGGKSFRNIRPASMSPDTLVIWICDQTGHAQCWRVWDMALASGARFELIPKGIQNAGIIAGVIDERLGRAKIS
jgi:hypothetical protein